MVLCVEGVPKVPGRRPARRREGRRSRGKVGEGGKRVRYFNRRKEGVYVASSCNWGDSNLKQQFALA